MEQGVNPVGVEPPVPDVDVQRRDWPPEVFKLVVGAGRASRGSPGSSSTPSDVFQSEDRDPFGDGVGQGVVGRVGAELLQVSDQLVHVADLLEGGVKLLDHLDAVGQRSSVVSGAVKVVAAPQLVQGVVVTVNLL